MKSIWKIFNQFKKQPKWNIPSSLISEWKVKWEILEILNIILQCFNLVEIQVLSKINRTVEFEMHDMWLKYSNYTFWYKNIYLEVPNMLVGEIEIP